ncbi:MAG: hypothetical protein AB4041_07170 [Microcystaceae cyanobacterium]
MFKNTTWLSLLLLLITYITFGWYIDQGKSIYQQFFIDYGRSWGWQDFLNSINLVETDVAITLVYGVATLSILLITIGLIAPITLITVAFGSSFKSNLWSIVSILLWSFTFVFILRWFALFSQFLLLLSAAILAKLDLQDHGLKQWKVSILIMMICFLGFVIGVISHSYLNVGLE